MSTTVLLFTPQMYISLAARQRAVPPVHLQAMRQCPSSIAWCKCWAHNLGAHQRHPASSLASSHRWNSAIYKAICQTCHHKHHRNVEALTEVRDPPSRDRRRDRLFARCRAAIWGFARSKASHELASKCSALCLSATCLVAETAVPHLRSYVFAADACWCCLLPYDGVLAAHHLHQCVSTPLVDVPPPAVSYKAPRISPGMLHQALDIFNPAEGGRSDLTGGHNGVSRPRPDPNAGHNGQIWSATCQLKSSS